MLCNIKVLVAVLVVFIALFFVCFLFFADGNDGEKA